MAFYRENEEDQNQTAMGGQTSFQAGPQSSAITPGQSAGTAAASGQGTQPSSSPTPDKPGNWVGIQDYLRQNKPSVENFSQQVQGNIQNVAGQAQNAIQGAKNTFAQNVSQNATQLDQGTINQIRQNPTQVTQNQALVDQIAKVRSTPTYSGPTSLEGSQGWQQASQELGRVQNLGDLAANSGGRQRMLQDLKQGERYGGGLSVLDTALLSSSEPGRQAFQTARDEAQRLGSFGQDILSQATQMGTQAKQNTENAFKMFQEQLTGANDPRLALEADLKKRLESQSAERERQANATIQAIQSGQASDTDLARLGLSREQFTQMADQAKRFGTQFGDAGLAQFINRDGSSNIGLSNVASTQDLARLQALNTLMGGESALNLDPNQLGKIDYDTVNFDMDAYNRFVQGLPQPVFDPGVTPMTYKPELVSPEQAIAEQNTGTNITDFFRKLFGGRGPSTTIPN